MQRLERRNNESELDYHKRIVYGKLDDKTLGDLDYSELAPFAYGKNYSSDVARRMFYGSYKTLKLLENESIREAESSGDKEMISKIDLKIFEFKKERQKLSDYTATLNRLLRIRSRQEELNDIIKNAINNSENLPPLTAADNASNSFDGNNDLLISLNDIHYGAGIDNYWRVYNPDVCREMFSEYLGKIRKIAETHKSENCIVWANGDLISGNIHKNITVTNKETVINQVKGVSELISEFLVQLSGIFKYVRFWSVAGNHSRIDKKEDALPDERLDDLVGWYLKGRLENNSNIIIEDCQIDPTMYVGNIRGKIYCGVHGDFDSSPTGFQVLQQMVKEPIYCVLLGHLHHNKEDTVQGIRTVMAGSFLGMDNYCISKRIVGVPQQKVCVCTEDGILCSYDVNL